MSKTILIVGTFDTKNDELRFIEQIIKDQNGQVLTMDVSVLGDPETPTDMSKHQVAEAAESSIEKAISFEDENSAMQIMALGASKLAAKAYADGQIDGVIVLGGTMGTDLALDVCSALPLGVPKYIVSTVSFSPLIPPQRLPADIQMILWAGGLYGLNSVCKASLSQAAGAVLGAARAVEKPDFSKPLVGMTSFGKTILRYMVTLKPELERRGYEVAVFHATGMGGRAFEDLAAQGRFCCVMDLATQEVGNHLFGSNISAGADRLTNAGHQGIPQIVAPGCHDLVDIVGWQDHADKWENHDKHAHNRLLTSVVLTDVERKLVAQEHAKKLASAKGKTAFIMPLKGCHEWDRDGAPLCHPAGLNTFAKEMKKMIGSNTDFYELDCHINDLQFCEQILDIFDQWFDHS